MPYEFPSPTPLLPVIEGDEVIDADAPMADLCWLRRQNLVATGFLVDAMTKDPQPGIDLLVGLGMRGCYGRWVREHGKVYVCPDWCRSESHPRRGIYDGCEPYHYADPSPWEAGQTFWVNVSAHDSRPAIYVFDRSAGDEMVGLTAADARQLASQLTAAADLLDKITTP